MTITLTPTLPIRFTLARLKQSFADPTLFSDADLLAFINEGYVTLVEQSRYLKIVQTISLIDGQQEYTLPPLCCEVLRVYIAGEEQIPIALDVAQTDLGGNYYYQLDRAIGFTQVPTGTEGTAVMWYASRPTPLGLDSIPIIPPEFYYLLRHYAAWRCILLQRGAEGVLKPYLGSPRAQMQRAIFDAGIHALRSEQVIEVAPRRLATSTPKAGVGAR